MIATLILALMPATVQDFEVRPQALEWEALENGRFDRAWTLPEAPREGRDLLDEMRRLSTLRFEYRDADGVRQASLGDLVAESGPLDKAARQAWFQGLERRAPGLMRDWRGGLGELLLDDKLQSKNWKPSKDHERDGILIGEDWELSEADGAPWSELEVTPRLAQAAALYRADLATIKEVENDYRFYPDNVGSDYEQINPARGRFYRGSGPSGNPFSTVAIEFTCDLPFPFSDYDCDLRILNRVDDAGNVRTDIYSTSRDFYFLAGRDVYLPVEDSSGQRVAYLVVRHFGFDLRGVPDKPKHRLEGVRATLGNLKRNAERRFAEIGRSFDSEQEAVAGFRVLGRD